MATMLDGESYLGRVMIRPLTKSGDIKMYLWPMRCLKSKIGGPTFGVDVNGEEILRFDPHGPRGHWHKGGYDKLGAGGSHVDYPEGVADVQSQIEWSIETLKSQGPQLLSEVGFSKEAAGWDADMVEAATAEISGHLQQEGDLLSKAVSEGLIAA